MEVGEERFVHLSILEALNLPKAQEERSLDNFNFKREQEAAVNNLSAWISSFII